MLSKSKSKTPNCPLDVKDLYNHFLKLSDPEDDFLAKTGLDGEEVLPIAPLSYPTYSMISLRKVKRCMHIL